MLKEQQAEAAVAMEMRTAAIHSRSLNYAVAGQGPVLLLVHGMGAGWDHWREVIEPLAREHTVIAPDLPGHGNSTPSAGDYSVGELAANLRDLLVKLGHERVTLVGHSLGGGVAMQFAYQFPEMVERLALVSTAGLGRQVSFILRSAALPGANLYMTITTPIWRAIDPLFQWALRAIGRPPSTDLAAISRGYGLLSDPHRRYAFLSIVRAGISARGQRVSARDRLYLAAVVPLLIVWGSADPLIPAWHGVEAHRHIEDSRLEIFEGVGHIPQLEEPERFVDVVQRFLEETEPAQVDLEDWKQLLRAGGARAGVTERSSGPQWQSA